MRIFQKAIFFIGFIFLLEGCGSNQVWVKNGITQAEFNSDKAQCEYEAASATANYNTGSTAYGIGAAAGQGFAEGITIGLKKIELQKLCMQAKGYYLATKDTVEKTEVKSVKNKELNYVEETATPTMECTTSLDCQSGKHCRSKKGGGTECR